MTSPDRLAFSPENEEMIRSVIKPGELVWGTQHDNSGYLANIIAEGIKPPRAHHHPHIYTSRPHSVCCALLASLPDRSGRALYHHAQHLGPTDNTSSGYAVILSRQKLLEEFSYCMQATGKTFTSSRYQDYYAYDPSKNAVFDIPLGTHSGTMEPFVSEVEIFYNPKIRDIPFLTPHYWTGIIARPDVQSSMQDLLHTHGFDLPIFSPENTRT